jgi:hypothetical protein
MDQGPDTYVEAEPLNDASAGQTADDPGRAALDQL